MKFSTATLVALIGFGVLGTAVAAGGCSGDSGSGSGSGAGGKSAGSGGGTGSGLGTGGDFGFDAGTMDDASLNEDSACVATSVQATYQQRPVDIIFVIDNSSSMLEEIVSVQDNINQNLAAVIEASGVDYRVIMVSQHGSAQDRQAICVRAPLGGDDCDPIPGVPVNNPPIFFQYNFEVGSYVSLCNILDTVKGGLPDRNNSAPGGWSEWLRDDSFKVFVEITDDNTECTTQTITPTLTLDDNTGESSAEGEIVARDFDAALLAVAPEFFGTAAERNYSFFSIVGLKENMPGTEPWPPTEPVTEGFRGQCSTAPGPGTGFQWLSVNTDGLRYPVCRFDAYATIFQAVANKVISGAKLSCDFVVPEPPPGQTLDLDTVVVQFTPTGGTPENFDQVETLADCKPKAFYIEETTIRLCPDVCPLVRADNSAEINVLYGCDPRAD